MATAVQLKANRANAKQSTGPNSEEGKKTASRNAVTHGLSGSHVILPGESIEDFQETLHGLTTEHRPATPTETILVQEMAYARWKMLRAAAIQQEVLSSICGESPNSDTPAGKIAASFLESGSSSQAIEKVERYEGSARRAFLQSLKQLATLQQAAARKKEKEEAIKNEQLDRITDAFMKLRAGRQADERRQALQSFLSKAEMALNKTKPIPRMDTAALGAQPAAPTSAAASCTATDGQSSPTSAS